MFFDDDDDMGRLVVLASLSFVLTPDLELYPWIPLGAVLL